MSQPSPASEPRFNDPLPAATACFSIQATAEPSVMPRILELFAKRGLIPCRWHSDLAIAELCIDLQVDGLSRQQVDHVAASIRNMVAVTSVLTSEKLYA
jgi:acetolactate synthase regulatory subunit